MENKVMYMYGGKVYGEKVSDYGLETGYLDYQTLARIVGPIIQNDYIRDVVPYEWELVNGTPKLETVQEFIITRNGYNLLAEYTDEIVFYHDELNMYIWAIDHGGTSWSYVSTGVKLIEMDVI